jgi:hypothetical protein
MTSETVTDIGKRAGLRLAAAYPGRHADKRIAADLDCSPAMARVLRAGRGWTVERLAQCAEKLGLLFIRDVFWPPLTQQQLDQRLDDLERRMAALEGVTDGTSGGARSLDQAGAEAVAAARDGVPGASPAPRSGSGAGAPPSRAPGQGLAQRWLRGGRGNERGRRNARPWRGSR